MDIRYPDIDETPLSWAEVKQGLREGIFDGPRARAQVFADVRVVSWNYEHNLRVEDLRVEVVNLPDETGTQAANRAQGGFGEAMT